MCIFFNIFENFKTHFEKRTKKCMSKMKNPKKLLAENFHTFLHTYFNILNFNTYLKY